MDKVRLAALETMERVNDAYNAALDWENLASEHNHKDEQTAERISEHLNQCFAIFNIAGVKYETDI